MTVPHNDHFLREVDRIDIRSNEGFARRILSKEGFAKQILSDWHIHTERSCDGACLEMRDLVREASRLSITDFGVTDHLHTSYNLPDIEKSKADYLTAVAADPGLAGRFHFGIEVSSVSQWEIDKVLKGDYKGDVTYGLRSGWPDGALPAIALDAGYIAGMGIEFVVGGVHWPLTYDLSVDSLIKDYHRQYMFLARHANVDILAHYLWWLPRSDAANPFEEFGGVPDYMKTELAEALLDNGCAFELNLEAMLLSDYVTEKFKREYLEYAAQLQSQGVTLAIGSDCHDKHYTAIDFEKSSRMIEESGVDLTKNIFIL